MKMFLLTSRDPKQFLFFLFSCMLFGKEVIDH